MKWFSHEWYLAAMFYEIVRQVRETQQSFPQNKDPLHGLYMVSWKMRQRFLTLPMVSCTRSTHVTTSNTNFYVEHSKIWVAQELPSVHQQWASKWTIKATIDGSAETVHAGTGYSPDAHETTIIVVTMVRWTSIVAGLICFLNRAFTVNGSAIICQGATIYQHVHRCF